MVKNKILFSFLFLLSFSWAQDVSAATFVVNDTGDATDATPGNGVCATAGAVCTLRAAIVETNALAGADTINFNAPPNAGNNAEIIPGSDLPTLTGGSLTIDGFTQPLSIANTNATGALNAVHTIKVNGGGLRRLFNIASDFNTIRGISIEQALEDGILITGNKNHIIGCDIFNNGNVGASDFGVEVIFSSSVGNTGSNFIGFDPAFLPANEAQRNAIHFNRNGGIRVSGDGNFGGTKIFGNLIGHVPLTLDPVGNGNGGPGVTINGSGHSVGSSGTNIPDIQSNNIAFNGDTNRNHSCDVGENGAGIAVTTGGANIFFFNFIFRNCGLGIDLGANGVTPNDVGDADVGANDLVNFPVITSITNTQIQGTTDFASGGVVQIYRNTAGDPSGNGEGEFFVANFNVTPGLWTFVGAMQDGVYSAIFYGSLGGVTGGSSEFSTNFVFPVVAPPPGAGGTIGVGGGNPATNVLASPEIPGLRAENITPASIDWILTMLFTRELYTAFINERDQILAQIERGLRMWKQGNLNPNTVYQMKARSVNQRGMSDPSELVSAVTLMESPAGLEQVRISDTSARFKIMGLAQFMGVGDAQKFTGEDKTGYLFQIEGSPLADSGWVKSIEHEFTGLIPSHDYRVRVKARNAAGVETVFSPDLAFRT
ncbi:MAG: parallel beta-helix repeat protein, partial [Parcubacteria group bacterium Greene1014_20]